MPACPKFLEQFGVARCGLEGGILSAPTVMADDEDFAERDSWDWQRDTIVLGTAELAEQLKKRSQEEVCAVLELAGYAPEGKLLPIAAIAAPADGAAGGADAEKQRLKKAKVLEEIISTEEHYVECVTSLLDEYYYPLRDAQFTHAGPILPMEQVMRIFSNVESIALINSELLEKLKVRGRRAAALFCAGGVKRGMLRFARVTTVARRGGRLGPRRRHLPQHELRAQALLAVHHQLRRRARDALRGGERFGPLGQVCLVARRARGLGRAPRARARRTPARRAAHHARAGAPRARPCRRLAAPPLSLSAARRSHYAFDRAPARSASRATCCCCRSCTRPRPRRARPSSWTS